jgi:hypothetical protein
MVEIKTSLRHEFGKTRSTSFGPIEFNEEGIAEVESEVADVLCKVSPSLQKLDTEGNVTPKTQETFTEASKMAVILETTPTPKTVLVNEVVAEGDEGKESEVESKGELVTTEEEVQEIKSEEEDITEIRANLEGMKISDIRAKLKDAGVAEELYDVPEFKGKEGKEALIEFTIKQITE